MAYDMYSVKKKDVKRVVKRAKRNPDARLGPPLCDNFVENKSFGKRGKRVRKGSGRKVGVKHVNR